jgi:DNA polymerase-3 subunit epsilon
LQISYTYNNKNKKTIIELTNEVNMRNTEPAEKSFNQKTLLQWANTQMFPKDVENGGTLCFIRDRSGKLLRNEFGKPKTAVYYSPDELRPLESKDEEYLISQYKTYKPQFIKTMTDDTGKRVVDARPIKAYELPITVTPVVDETNDYYRYQKKVADAVAKAAAEYSGDGVADKILYIDTETTGFSPVFNELLQVSILDEKGNTILDTYVKPYHTTNWDKAMEVNHITPDMVKDAPYPHELVKQLYPLFKETKEIHGYNVTYDVKMITQQLQLDLTHCTMFDPLPAFNKVKTENGKHKLIDAVTYYCPDKLEEFANGAHNSLIDIIATKWVEDAMDAMAETKKECQETEANSAEYEQIGLDLDLD